MNRCERIREFAEKRAGEWVTFEELAKEANIERQLLYDTLRRIDLKKIANFDLGFTIEKKSNGGRSKLLRFVKQQPSFAVVKVEQESHEDLTVMPHIVTILKSQSESIKMMREDIKAIREDVKSLRGQERDPITRGMLLKLEIIQEKILEMSEDRC